MAVTERYTPLAIAQIVGAECVSAAGEAPLITQWVYDTRNLLTAEGAVFLALRGEQRDGHAFCRAAYDRGVRVFWVERAQPDLPGAWQIVAPQGVLPSLQRLAQAHRAQMTYPVVGITGSNGKTIVKEWLAALLEGSFHVAKSPGSFNSQLGVALALLELRAEHQLALIECGISERGEMARLEALVCPTLGLLTHFGDAHADGFASDGEKLSEKLRLFSRCPELIASADDAFTRSSLAAGPWQWLSVGREGTLIRLLSAEWADGAWRLSLEAAGARAELRLAQPGEAAIENLLLALGAAVRLGAEWRTLIERVPSLQPVSMRTEMITDNPELTLISDAYNADAASVRQAFAVLERAGQHPRRRLILADLEHQGPQAFAVQRGLVELAIARFGTDAVELIGPVGLTLSRHLGVRAYRDTEDLLAALDYERYVGATVLLKGARRWRLERLIAPLSRHPSATLLRVNLDALVHNLRAIRRRLPPHTEVVCMLKASAYGAGAWQLAQRLDREGVAAYAVAYPAEGIDLRRHGITTPILVLNADASALADCVAHALEPVIWSLPLLAAYAEAAERAGLTRAPLHLEFDTGMGRLGFAVADAPEVLRQLEAYPRLLPRSAFTHLAASDEPEQDEFTLHQLRQLQQVLAVMRARVELAGHALNTAGILRFGHHPEAQGLNWARLGVGLYGISPVPELQRELIEVGSLITQVSQLHRYPAGATVGYARAEVLARDSVIATLPLGYADGLPRRLGGRKLSVIVRGRLAPIVGRVCMDMIMVDVTEVIGVAEGDEVVVFGRQGGAQQSVADVAAAADTIAYEILAGLSPRIRRVYVSEATG